MKKDSENSASAAAERFGEGYHCLSPRALLLYEMAKRRAKRAIRPLQASGKRPRREEDLDGSAEGGQGDCRVD